MTLRKKIKEIEDKLDLTKRYPNYFNKLIFRIGFGVMIFFIFSLLVNFGLNATWVNIECESKECLNPYIECKEELWVKNLECKYYEEHPCKGRNCESRTIYEGDYIGEKPPNVVLFGNLIIFGILGLTFLLNDMYYRGRKK